MSANPYKRRTRPRPPRAGEAEGKGAMKTEGAIVAIAALTDRDRARSEERGFIRGFAAATAMTLRHQVNAEDMLRSISATERSLSGAGVIEFDMVELLPVLRRLEKSDGL